VRLVGIHRRFIAPRYRRGCPAAITLLCKRSGVAAGLVLSYLRAHSVRVSRGDAHGVTKKASGPCELPAG
jgi:hypothetical protein